MEVWTRPKSDEERLAELEARVKALELRPFPQPIWWYYPQPCVPPPYPFWTGVAGACAQGPLISYQNTCQPAYAGNQLTISVM